MSQLRKVTPTPPPAEPARTRPESASTADGVVAERAALAERERRTAQAMTAARRLGRTPEPRP